MKEGQHLLTFLFLILCPLKLWTISPDHIQKGRDEVGAETKGFTIEQITERKTIMIDTKKRLTVTLTLGRVQCLTETQNVWKLSVLQHSW